MNREDIKRFFQGSVLNGITRDVVFLEHSEEGWIECDLVALPPLGIEPVHLSFPEDERAIDRKEIHFVVNVNDWFHATGVTFRVSAVSCIHWRYRREGKLAEALVALIGGDEVTLDKKAAMRLFEAVERKEGEENE